MVLDAKTRATVIDDRRDYGEVRYQTAGFMDGRPVVVVWTPRDATRHIISMRHCHDDEAKIWRERME